MVDEQLLLAELLVPAKLTLRLVVQTDQHRHSSVAQMELAILVVEPLAQVAVVEPLVQVAVVEPLAQVAVVEPLVQVVVERLAYYRAKPPVAELQVVEAVEPLAQVQAVVGPLAVL
jgi:hypothetical protein